MSSRIHILLKCIYSNSYCLLDEFFPYYILSILSFVAFYFFFLPWCLFCLIWIWVCSLSFGWICLHCYLLFLHHSSTFVSKEYQEQGFNRLQPLVCSRGTECSDVDPGLGFDALMTLSCFSLCSSHEGHFWVPAVWAPYFFPASGSLHLLVHLPGILFPLSYFIFLSSV